MPRFDESYPGMIDALATRYGMPAADLGEVETFAGILAAALGRAVEGKRVGKVLNGLRDAGLLEPDALAEADPTEITEALRSAGAKLPAQAIGLLKRLGQWLVDRHHGSVEELPDVPTAQLREELSALNGVGPARADAILLFGLNRPVFPVDRASYRILVRHGWLEPFAEYEEARDLLERHSQDDPAALARLATWLDRIGRDACRATRALCDRCPLQPFLPEGGPIEPE